jgi:3-phenylpropionate/trans-cinnamate dioxygenase ferredoxin component
VTWQRACSAAALVENSPLGVVVDQVALCLVRTRGDVFAVHDECTHESVRLSEGFIDDGVIGCWRHGSCFDLRTGAVLNPPAHRSVVVDPVGEAMDEVQVELQGLT